MKNYVDYVRKIALIVAIFIFIVEIIYQHFFPEINSWFNDISFGIVYEEYGNSIKISLMYLPLLYFILETVFKIHNRISDIFKIRYYYDREVIIKTYLKILKINKNLKNINDELRKDLMDKIFYKYVSPSKQIVDEHLISMVMTNFQYFWIDLEVFIISFALLISTFFVETPKELVIIILSILLISFVSLFLLIKQCEEYSIKEVNQILLEVDRSKRIKKVILDAL